MDSRNIYQEEVAQKNLALSSNINETCDFNIGTDDPWLYIIIAVLYLYQVVLAYRILDSKKTTTRCLRALLFIPISTLNYLRELARVALFYYIILHFIRKCEAQPRVINPVTVEHQSPESPVTIGTNPFIDQPTTCVNQQHHPSVLWFENEVKLTTPTLLRHE